MARVERRLVHCGAAAEHEPNLSLLRTCVSGQPQDASAVRVCGVRLREQRRSGRRNQYPCSRAERDGRKEGRDTPGWPVDRTRRVASRNPPKRLRRHWLLEHSRSSSSLGGVRVSIGWCEGARVLERRARRRSASITHFARARMFWRSAEVTDTHPKRWVKKAHKRALI